MPATTGCAPADLAVLPEGTGQRRPSAETREQIAGFNVLECAHLDQAIEVASRHPTATIGTFELRPFWQE
jgi:hypothetical protein